MSVLHTTHRSVLSIVVFTFAAFILTTTPAFAQSRKPKKSKTPAYITGSVNAPIGLRWGMSREESAEVMSQRPGVIKAEQTVSEQYQERFSGGTVGGYTVVVYTLSFNEANRLYGCMIGFYSQWATQSVVEEFRKSLADIYGAPTRTPKKEKDRAEYEWTDSDSLSVYLYYWGKVRSIALFYTDLVAQHRFQEWKRKEEQGDL